ncbi:RDD family protein [Singulisphaera acidiphila]|uniref:Putative membrane protein/domain protein n=1 Tax=Singulisphaera acidiphila (strain ATCC BAA-1392 / DSM 18658 / VKM B-2454 / MOB10) TaxID=886293 RepID=L0DI02_SINAD|nr:RDD family protein [Singulisphaera acidiphila]AGA29019.1 putative membrane protein/domain protein [Singulisphaera acidiphila DSM 18658]
MSYVEDIGNNPYAAPNADFSYHAPVMEKGFEYAGFWRRFAAFFLDSIIVGFANNLVGFTLGFVLALAGVSMTVIQITGFLVGILISIRYYVGMTSSSKQATWGKRAMGIKVVDLNGRRLSFGKAFVREFAKVLSGLLLLIGYIMAAFTERKQGLHDLIAGTLVVKSR